MRMCHNAIEETVVPCVLVDEIHSDMKIKSNRWDKAYYWYWEDLHTQKCVPDWDEVAL